MTARRRSLFREVVLERLAGSNQEIGAAPLLLAPARSWFVAAAFTLLLVGAALLGGLGRIPGRALPVDAARPANGGSR